MRTLFCALIATLSLATPALAQNADGTPTVYNATNYSITPPANWKIVSGTLTEKELSKLPENINKQFSQRNTDVIFLNKPDKQNSGFMNNLNIVSIGEEIVLTDEVIKELEAQLKQQYVSMFGAFEMETIEKQTEEKQETLHVKGSYSALNYNITMEQFLMPHGKTSVVLTCTYVTDKGQADGDACKEAVKTLKFKN